LPSLFPAAQNLLGGLKLEAVAGQIDFGFVLNRFLKHIADKWLEVHGRGWWWDFSTERKVWARLPQTYSRAQNRSVEEDRTVVQPAAVGGNAFDIATTLG